MKYAGKIRAVLMVVAAGMLMGAYTARAKDVSYTMTDPYDWWLDDKDNLCYLLVTFDASNGLITKATVVAENTKEKEYCKEDIKEAIGADDIWIECFDKSFLFVTIDNTTAKKNMLYAVYKLGNQLGGPDKVESATMYVERCDPKEIVFGSRTIAVGPDSYTFNLYKSKGLKDAGKSLSGTADSAYTLLCGNDTWVRFYTAGGTAITRYTRTCSADVSHEHDTLVYVRSGAQAMACPPAGEAAQ